MKTRVSIVTAAVIFLSLGVGGLRLIMGGEAVSRFDMGEITRGDLENTIACSGTITPAGMRTMSSLLHAQPCSIG